MSTKCGDQHLDDADFKGPKALKFISHASGDIAEISMKDIALISISFLHFF